MTKTKSRINWPTLALIFLFPPIGFILMVVAGLTKRVAVCEKYNYEEQV